MDVSLTAYLLAHAATHTAGFDLALKTAAGSLLLGAGFYGLLMRRYPVGR